jgi:hypothetical protein
MKLQLTILITFVFISCQSLNESDKRENSNQFFDFDEIDYYHKDIMLEEWLKMATKENKSTDEIAFLKIINENYPTSTKDKQIISELDKLYPLKGKIKKEKFKEIGNIFSEKFHGDYALAACDPLYRDILVFKKKQDIVGISKICFECGLHITIGTSKNTEQLGQNGDYEKLKLLLEK